MIGRRQLPVSSTITARSLVSAIAPALGGGARELAALRAELERAFDASGVALVDSGTSALVLALRASTRAGGIVALPAYACVDIGAAAIFAQLRVRLYDVDPTTLSADLDSVNRVLSEGADSIVVSHLYGFPSDVPGVSSLAAAHGVAVIEDAAQGAWGSLLGKRLGAFGPWSVLSFGRGKGMTGGGGGALLRIGSLGEVISSSGVAPARSGLRTLVTTTAQWALGRPSLYSLPSAIPSLHLGETIYHPAHEPRAITPVSATLVLDALARAEADLAVRRAHGDALARAAEHATGVQATRAIGGASPGFLRFPVRVSDHRAERPELGIVRGYPNTLAELEPLAPLVTGDESLTGAKELQRTLMTLPTHALLTSGDLQKISSWLS